MSSNFDPLGDTPSPPSDPPNPTLIPTHVVILNPPLRPGLRPRNKAVNYKEKPAKPSCRKKESRDNGKACLTGPWGSRYLKDGNSTEEEGN